MQLGFCISRFIALYRLKTKSHLIFFKIKVNTNYLPYGTASGVKNAALKILLHKKPFLIPALPSCL